MDYYTTSIQPFVSSKLGKTLSVSILLFPATITITGKVQENATTKKCQIIRWMLRSGLFFFYNSIYKFKDIT